MKKILAIIAATFTLYSCNSTPSYIITGQVSLPDLEGAAVLLTHTDRGTRITTTYDSTAVKDGSFELKGTADTAKFYTIQINKTDAPIKVNFVLENAPITITIDGNGSKVSGTPTNDTLQQYLDQIAELNRQLSDIRNEYKNLKETGSLTDEAEKSLAEKGDALSKQILDLQKEFSAVNINNPAGQTVARNIAYRLSVDENRQIIANADSTTLQTVEVKFISDLVIAQEKTAVGQKYIDLSYTNPDGQKIALSDYVEKNKYVVIDFWASWCPYCIADMPNIIEVYKQYKDKGLEIVGISLDKTRDPWVKSIKDLGITWPQMSELKFWDAEAVKLYGVAALPHMVLISQDGAIVARGFDGKGLGEMLKEYLK